MTGQIIFFLIITLCTPAYAVQPKPDDFAYGLSLTPQSESAIHSVMLPESVYRHITRSDFGDMRVFNKQGEIVPYLLRRPEISSQTIEPAILPFFPIYADIGKQGSEFSFQLSADGKGSILSIQAKSGTQPAGNITAYIIDASSIDRIINEIEAQWHNNGESFVTTVSVESGDDLTHWQTMVNAATLAKLQYGEHRLDQNRITLPARKAKYFRLSWSAGKQGAELTALNALFYPTASEPDRSKTTISGTSIDKPNVYEFDAKGLFPIDKINLILPQRNSLAQVVVKSRSDSKEEWKIRHRGVFHNLIVEENRLNNAPISLSPVLSDRFWRIESDDSGGMGTGIPALEISWIPHELLFLTRGESPFQLAYGSANIKLLPEASMNHLFDGITMTQGHVIKKAIPGNEITLSGTGRLKPTAPPFPWKKFLLWSVLVCGVLILGRMAWLLYQQMNSPDKEV